VEEKRIGIFGGVFDPVHTGHTAVVRAALDFFSLETLYVVPCGTPAHKPAPVLSADGRFRLLNAAFQGDPRVVISDLEIRSGGISYTYKTIAAVAQDEGVKPYFFIGGDNLPEIRTWKYPEQILASARVVAVIRPGYDFLEKFPEYQGKITPLPMPPMTVSSSQVREMLKRGEDAGGLVPGPAHALILKHGYYR
jgi:nicotinate-nucleotide adenylyltransferase